jgi:hypothetical protein
MADEKNVLDEESEEVYDIEEAEEEEIEEDAEELEDESEEETEDGTDDVEFDEDGNLVLNDDEESEEEEAEEEDEGKPAEDQKEEKPKESTPTDTSTKRLADLERQAKDTLKKLGVELKDGDDIQKALAQLAAEADGVTLDEYLKKAQEETQKEEATKLLQKLEFEKMAAADLAELQREFPETRAYKSIMDMPEAILAEFGRYRDLGIPAKKAYAAANPDGIRTNVAEAVKKKSAQDNKSHLRSAVTKRSHDNGVKITRAELEEWRSLFPRKSDKEIYRLYKQTLDKEN